MLLISDNEAGAMCCNKRESDRVSPSYMHPSTKLIAAIASDHRPLTYRQAVEGLCNDTNEGQCHETKIAYTKAKNLGRLAIYGHALRTHRGFTTANSASAQI